MAHLFHLIDYYLTSIHTHYNHSALWIPWHYNIPITIMIIISSSIGSNIIIIIWKSATVCTVDSTSVVGTSLHSRCFFSLKLTWHTTANLLNLRAFSAGFYKETLSKPQTWKMNSEHTANTLPSSAPDSPVTRCIKQICFSDCFTLHCRVTNIFLFSFNLAVKNAFQPFNFCFLLVNFLPEKKTTACTQNMLLFVQISQI